MVAAQLLKIGLTYFFDTTTEEQSLFFNRSKTSVQFVLEFLRISTVSTSSGISVKIVRVNYEASDFFFAN